MTPFNDVLSTDGELRDVFRQPSARAVAKQIDRLDDHCREFVAHSPFVVVGTSNPDGTGDVSPKGGPPGFVRVLDEHRLAMGELPGNNRLDGYRNLIRDSRVGLLFLIPGLDETLRVNGRGFVVTDPEVLEVCALDGRLPPVALGIEVGEAFIHCAKALRRSQIWEPTAWPDRSTMATPACMLVTHAGITGDPQGIKTAEALDVGNARTMWNPPPE